MIKSLIIIVGIFFASADLWLLKNYFFSASDSNIDAIELADSEEKLQIDPPPPQNMPVNIETEVLAVDNDGKLINEMVSPLERASERVTKKPFGILINPKTSPVQPERFSGYHTGTDFEIFPEEQNVDVSVKAICSGSLVFKDTVNGYGGVAIQQCTLKEQLVTVIYGHLRLSSINFSVGDKIEAGAELGVLGAGYSQETDGERKHLHLGVHKGAAINVRGYVNTKNALDGWLNPEALISN
jgi:murein DD-endopeptidase MepM/ murein hydrolase activator NlpD